MKHNPSWQAYSFSASQDISCILWNPLFIIVFTKSHHLSVYWARLVTAHTTPYIMMDPSAAWHSTWTSWSLKIGPIVCPWTLVSNYQHVMHNIPEDWRPQIYAFHALPSCFETTRSKGVTEIFKNIFSIQ